MSYSERFMAAWGRLDYDLATKIASESPTNIFLLQTPGQWGKERFGVWMASEFDKITDLDQLAKVRSMFLSLSALAYYQEYCQPFVIDTTQRLVIDAWNRQDYTKVESLIMDSAIDCLGAPLSKGSGTLLEWLQDSLLQIQSLLDMWTIREMFLRISQSSKFFIDQSVYEQVKKIEERLGPMIAHNNQEIEELREDVRQQVQLINDLDAFSEEHVYYITQLAEDNDLQTQKIRDLTEELEGLKKALSEQSEITVKQTQEIEVLNTENAQFLSEKERQLKTVWPLIEEQLARLKRQEEVILAQKRLTENLEAQVAGQVVMSTDKDVKIALLERKIETQAFVLQDNVQVIAGLDKTIESQSHTFGVREAVAERREFEIKELEADLDQKTAQRSNLERFVFETVLSPQGYQNFPGGHEQSLNNVLGVIRQDQQWSSLFKAKVLDWLLEESKLIQNSDQGFIVYLSRVHPLLTELLTEYFRGRLESCKTEMQRLESQKEAMLASDPAVRGVHVVVPILGRTFRPFDSIEYAALGESSDHLKLDVAYYQGWVDRLVPVLSPAMPAPLLLSQASQGSGVVSSVSVEVTEQDFRLLAPEKLTA